MVLPNLKRHLTAKNTWSDHDGIHGQRILNYIEHQAITRHRYFNAPKICKSTAKKIHVCTVPHTCTWTCRFADQSTSSLGQSKQVIDWYGFVLEALRQLLISECYNDINKKKKYVASLFLAFAVCSHCGSATRAAIVRRTCCSVTEKSYAEEPAWIFCGK